MGRMARYLLAAFRAQPDIEARVLDSWTRAVLENAILLSWQSVAIVRLLRARRSRTSRTSICRSVAALRKLVLLRAAGLLGVPTILHLHGSEFAVFCDQLSPRLRGILVRTMARAARIVVIGSFWRQFLVQVSASTTQRSSSWPTAFPSRSARSQSRRHDGPCRIVYLGLLGRRKGTSDLLQALASPRLRDMRWDAVIAGNGDVDAFRAEAAAAGIADRVDLSPAGSDPRKPRRCSPRPGYSSCPHTTKVFQSPS